MDDNGRLILGTSFDAENDVNSNSGSSQNLNTSTPAGIENTASLDVSLPVDGTVIDDRNAPDSDADSLIIPVSINIIDSRIMSVSLDTRLASNRWAATAVSEPLDFQFSMASQLRSRDQYLTIVDMTAQQPGIHHLLKEGGSGFITFEKW